MIIAPTLAILAVITAADSSPFAGVFVISGFASDSLIVVDAATGELQHTIHDNNLDGPLGMTLAPDRDELLVCSELTGSVERYDTNTWQHLGALINKGEGGLEKPASIIPTADNNSLLVADFESSSILQFNAKTGAFERTIVEPKAGNLLGPDVGMTLTTEGQLLVPSFWNHQLIAYDISDPNQTNAETLATHQQGIRRPRTILQLDDGSILITNEAAATVTRVSADFSMFDPHIEDSPATKANETGGLQAPSGMTIGPEGDLYITDVNQNRVMQYDLETGKYLGTPVPKNTGGIQAPTFILYIPPAN